MTLPRRFVVMLSLLNIAAAAAMLAVTPLAAAQDADAATGAGREPVRIVVNHADLDLSRRAGVAILYARLQRAAKAACGDPTGTGTRVVRPQWKACVSEAVDAAVATLDRAAVTAYHAERTGTAARIARAADR